MARNTWTAFGKKKNGKPGRMIVVGPQKSADETVDHLRAHYPEFTVKAVYDGEHEKEPTTPAAASPAAKE